MKNTTRSLSLALAISTILFTSGELSAKKVPLPDTTHDGLERVEKNAKSDVVYLLPGAEFSQYTEVILLEPHMAFHKGWQDWYNGSAPMMDRISDRDMDKMLKRGKKVFIDTFTKTLEKKGYPVVKTPGDSVLLLRPAVINIEVTVPDPDRMKGMGRGGSYAETAGSMTFVLELYDSVSGQILLRAVDRESNIDEGWRIPRDYSSNNRAARMTYDLWAKRLAKGLDNAKKQ